MLDKIERLKEQLNNLDTKIEAKQKEINALTEKRETLQNKIITAAMTENNFSITEVIEAIQLLKDELKEDKVSDENNK